MDILTYKQRKLEAQSQGPKQRVLCPRCLQPSFSCYCELLQPIDPNIVFVILIHPIEVARRIATGRMSHLLLKKSHLISGHDFTHNANLNAILADSNLHCMMLYPGSQSANLTNMSETEKFALTPEGKKLALLVIDGTWATARKMVNRSQNLHGLPRICFTPSQPSNFRIRRQPRPECYSTIEAIHQTIELLSPHSREHDHLLSVFEKMVSRQLELAHGSSITPWNLL